MDSFTTDTFFNGQVKVKQSRRGYRFSIDAVLLAYHTRPRPGESVLDLGTGCGIIPLLLLFRHPAIRIYAVEIQHQLAELAADNARDNGLQDRMAIIEGDLASLGAERFPSPIDIIVSNPPYRRPNSGRINPDGQRAVARHEIKTTLGDVVHTAKRILRVGGRFITIYTADRLTDMLFLMRENRIEPKYMRMIHSSDKTEAKLFLVEGVHDGRPGMKIDSPVVLYADVGEYTDDVKRMFRP